MMERIVKGCVDCPFNLAYRDAEFSSEHVNWHCSFLEPAQIIPSRDGMPVWCPLPITVKVGVTVEQSPEKKEL